MFEPTSCSVANEKVSNDVALKMSSRNNESFFVLVRQELVSGYYNCTVGTLRAEISFSAGANFKIVSLNTPFSSPADFEAAPDLDNYKLAIAHRFSQVKVIVIAKDKETVTVYPVIGSAD